MADHRLRQDFRVEAVELAWTLGLVIAAVGIWALAAALA